MAVKIRLTCESVDAEEKENVVSTTPPGAAKPVVTKTKVNLQSGRLKSTVHDDNKVAFAEVGHGAAELSITGLLLESGVTLAKGQEYVLTLEPVTPAAPTAPVAPATPAAAPVAPTSAAT